MNSTIQSYPDWVRDSIFYQIFPDRFNKGGSVPPGRSLEPWGNLPTAGNFFGGNLDGISQKLDHLKGLNINTMYIKSNACGELQK